ncbi:MAG: serine/threonine-protein phosphatase [Magnetococcales bacterium]|nr:serine/threonine-protein phosphatase [Magnetococcales bacterium]
MTLTIGDRLLAAGNTDVGCVRTLNEDNYFVDDKLGLLIIADGMGGHSAGEVASAQVIASVRESLKKSIKSASKETILAAQQSMGDGGNVDDEATLDDIPNPVVAMLRDASNAANTAINNINREHQHGEGTGMGSTLVGLWLPSFSEVPVAFHVGDSRLYHYSKNGLTQVTQDHSMYQRWVNLGSKGPAPAQNILLQAVGPSEHITPDINFKEMEKGDVVLLCSDGLTGMVSTKAIEKVLATANEYNLDSVVDLLIELARNGGGKDNISVIVGCFVK